MSPNRKVIESLYQAFTRRDVAAILTIVSPEIVVTQSPALPWGGDYSGHAGLQNFFTNLLRHVESNVHIEQIIDAGEQIVVIGRTNVTVRANGKAFDVPVAHVWQLRDGKPVIFRPCIENTLMLEALS